MVLTGLPKATRVTLSTHTIPAGVDRTAADAVGACKLIAIGALKERDIVNPAHDPTLDFMLKQSGFKFLLKRRFGGLKCVGSVLPRAACSVANAAEATALGAPKVFRVEDTLMVWMLGKRIISLIIEDDLRVCLLAEFRNLISGLAAV